MSDVEFSGEEAYKAEIMKRVGPMVTKTGSKIIDLPIKLGLAKDLTGANIVLAVVGVLALLAALLVFLVAR